MYNRDLILLFRMLTRGPLSSEGVSWCMGCRKRFRQGSGLGGTLRKVWDERYFMVFVDGIIKMCFAPGSVKTGRALGFELRMQNTLSCNQMVTKLRCPQAAFPSLPNPAGKVLARRLKAATRTGNPKILAQAAVGRCLVCGCGDL